MFMGPAGIHTRGCRRAFDLSPLLGLLKRVSLLKLVQPGCILAGSPDGEWNTTDLIHCIYANNMSPQGSAMALVLTSGRAASIHEHLCAAGPGIVSLCRPPVLRNASGCQFQTALSHFDSQYFTQSRGSLLSVPYATLESACSDV